MGVKEELLATIERAKTIAEALPSEPTPDPTPTETIYTVKAGDDLQKALDQAAADKSGKDVRVKVAPKAVYRGNFNVKPKVHDRMVYVEADWDFAANLGDGRSVNPDMPQLACLNTSMSTLYSVASRGWSWHGFYFPYTGNAARWHVDLGSPTEGDPTRVARDWQFTQCLFRGSTTFLQRRAIVANCGRLVVDRCSMYDIGYAGQDGQCILGYNGPGPFLITGNCLEGAGENILFGGGTVRTDAMVPRDIQIIGNLLTKNPNWLKLATKPTVKKLLELKCAERVDINGNLMEGCWPPGQDGGAITFKAASGGETTPLVRTHHVKLRNNVVRKAGLFLTINNTEGPTATLGCDDIEVENNLVYELGLPSFPDLKGADGNPMPTGNGKAFRFGGGPDNVSLRHNTLLNLNTFIELWNNGDKLPGFEAVGNLAREGTYGVKGDGFAQGLPSINAYFPNSIFTANAFENGSSTAGYPAGNTVLPTGILPAGLDAQFRPVDPKILAIKDANGKVVGAEIDVILAIFKNYGLSL